MKFLRQIAGWLKHRSETPTAVASPAVDAAENSQRPRKGGKAKQQKYRDFLEIFGRAITVDTRIVALRIASVTENEQAISFRGVRIWHRDEAGEVRLYQGAYSVAISSQKLRNKGKDAAYCPATIREVNFHSVSETEPRWELRFPKPVHVSHIEFWARPGPYGRKTYPLAFSVQDSMDEWSQVALWTRQHAEIEAIQQNLEHLAEQMEGQLPGIKETTASIRSVLARDIDTALASDAPLLREIAAHCAVQNGKPLVEVGNWPKSAATVQMPAGEVMSARRVRVTTYGQYPFDLGVVLCKGLGGDGNPVEHGFPALSVKQVTQNPAELVAVLDAGYMQLPRQVSVELPAGFQLQEVKFWGLPDNMRGVATLHDIHVEAGPGDWRWIGGSGKLYRLQLALYRLWSWLEAEESREFQLSFVAFMTRYRRKLIETYIRNRNKDRTRLREMLDEIRRVGDGFVRSPKIMYTKHGLGVSLATKDTDQLLEKMVSFQAVMKAVPGVSIFPCYGTLLGFHRDKGFIPHDDDIDWACIVPITDGEDPFEVRNAWCRKFIEAGMDVKQPAGRNLNMHFRHQGEVMDVFLMLNRGSETLAHMEAFQIRPVKTDLLLPLQEAEFMGRKFLAPAQIEGFLKDRYGDGWVVSDPTYGI